jgi:amidohydrolase
MEGSIRCLHDGDAALRERFAELCKAVCATYRCTCDVEFKCGNTLLNNDKEMTRVATRAAEKVVGENNILTDHIAVMLGDDFAEFSNRVPGVYYFIGTRNEAAGSVYEHHHHHFTIDEDSLAIGVMMQAEIVMDYLK